MPQTGILALLIHSQKSAPGGFCSYYASAMAVLLRSQGEKADGGGMSDQQVRDEALTLFLTAFDTTSTALTWAWYLLSQNPEAEAELHEELDLVLKGRLPTAENMLGNGATMSKPAVAR